MENLQVRFGERGFAPVVEVPLHNGERTLAQAVGRIHREGKYARVFSEDGIVEHVDNSQINAPAYVWHTWGSVCGLEILSETGEQVGVIRFLNLDVGNQHLFTSLAWRGGYATEWKLTLNDPADKEASFTLFEVKNGIEAPEKGK